MTESKTASGQAISTDHADETNAKASAGAQKNNPATSTVGEPRQTADAKQTVTPKKRQSQSAPRNQKSQRNRSGLLSQKALQDPRKQYLHREL